MEKFLPLLETKSDFPSAFFNGYSTNKERPEGYAAKTWSFSSVFGTVNFIRQWNAPK